MSLETIYRCTKSNVSGQWVIDCRCCNAKTHHPISVRTREAISIEASAERSVLATGVTTVSMSGEEQHKILNPMHCLLATDNSWLWNGLGRWHDLRTPILSYLSTASRRWWPLVRKAPLNRHRLTWPHRRYVNACSIGTHKKFTMTEDPSFRTEVIRKVENRCFSVEEDLTSDFNSSSPGHDQHPSHHGVVYLRILRRYINCIIIIIIFSPL